MKKFDQINIIPFIDIMLVLLTIVLVTASFISQGKIQVDVPKASTEVKFKANDLAKLLTITQKGEVYLNDKPITLAELDDVAKHWENGQPVTLKVDSRSPFQAFVTITDIFAKYNIKNVAIVTMKEKAR
ncbi:TonB system transport protein ExbD [Actinobacillus delphinicola]|uniref:Biopolymer transport protein ExbD n=1 Tax=Actinobacillus delphinicola TaxID=51161 RepID=A0A448TUN4_9PAST|nr:TonB system transport protein ExbD [Actinobacillus delphinicola]MDG6897653.1 TonB system transport protein ExbD [Actinobacillus delphinicola]VEJ09533.1 TonB system transport protein ExbD type-2 [Actinobacillus delphinicola]